MAFERLTNGLFPQNDPNRDQELGGDRVLEFLKRAGEGLSGVELAKLADKLGLGREQLLQLRKQVSTRGNRFGRGSEERQLAADISTGLIGVLGTTAINQLLPGYYDDNRTEPEPERTGLRVPQRSKRHVRRWPK
jgi:hypothetical protein